MSEVVRYQMMSLHIDRINITSRCDRIGGSKHQIQKNEEEEEEENNKSVKKVDSENSFTKKKVEFTTNGKMSFITQRKLKRAVNYLNFISKEKTAYLKGQKRNVKFRMTFVTLTLSSEQIHTDNEIKNVLLNQFIVECKKKYSLNNYIWRSEKQANKNVHFHFICDCFIPYQELTEMWNRIQNKLGYVDRYAEKMQKISYEDYKKTWRNWRNVDERVFKNAYAKGVKTNWRYPNSTDIHNLFFINNIDAYLIKYLSKEEQNEGLEGRLWGCSQNLTNIRGAQEIIDSKINEEIETLKKQKGVRQVDGEYYSVVLFSFESLKNAGCKMLLEMITYYLKERFNFEVS